MGHVRRAGVAPTNLFLFSNDLKGSEDVIIHEAQGETSNVNRLYWEIYPFKSDLQCLYIYI